ncbi:MAG: membrane protein insertase YidC [Betaproteobacteria bacterium]
MEKRVLIAIFLSFLVLYLYQAFVGSPESPSGAPGKPGAAAHAIPGAATSKQAGAGGQPETPAAPRPEAAPAAPTPATVLGDSVERDVRVETRDVVATFTNRGARLKSWQLKHYFNQTTGAPLELVANDLAATHPLPFTLKVDSPQVSDTLNSALYVVHEAPSGSAAESTPTAVTFEYRNTAGVHAVKTFRLDPDSYAFTFRAEVTDGDRPLRTTVVWGPAVGDAGNETSRYVQKPEGLYFDTKVRRVTPKDIAKQSTYQGDFRYAGVDDHYFLTTALFPGNSTVTFQPVVVPPAAGTKDAERDLVSYSITPSAAGSTMKFFVGPKDFDVLSGIDRDFVRAINFGIFAILVVPLLRSLEWVNGYIGNYGWSIITLTIIINAIMFPLRHKSVVSMRKMQEVQPQVKAIQERYAKLKATDPAKQKMNQELMALYREKGVNPASGCLPMILTMPVLFAMWSLLSTAIELRGAPWFGWIHDLSAHDPLYVWPVLMGVTQLWQQKITPTAGADPTQQKMMMVMPVVFTAMFLWAPAGLAIYYGVTNLWGIGQQYVTNRLIGPPQVHNVRPAAERRVKRVGGGKTEAASRESPS